MDYTPACMPVFLS